jgi:hypothetical protein
MIARSRGLPMVKVEHAAEALTAQNTPGRRHLVLRRIDQKVVEPLMISFCVIMHDVFADEVPKVSLAKWHDLG